MMEKSLLNKVPRVSQCSSAQMPFEYLSAQLPECLSVQEPWGPECPSALQVPECLKCQSGQVP